MSLLASGRSESCLLPPHSVQYVVRGDFTLGSAVPGNPSLLSLFERPLRPSLQLGLTVREAATLKASSRSLSEALSHAMWLLSGLLGFFRLQGLLRVVLALVGSASVRSILHPVRPLLAVVVAILFLLARIRESVLTLLCLLRR